ncbi:MAG: hypothetical protein IJW79_03675 [Clostridia bacterium]|nr:hypothetical protein [Clostridia bacterium]
MSKVKKIAEWTVIALFGVIVVAFLSIFTYRAVVSSDWYIEGQTEKAYKQMVEKVNDHDNIKHIQTNISEVEGIIFDAPKELFDDISCKSFKYVTDPEERHRIFRGDFVTVFYLDGTYTSFSILDKEVYWQTDLKIECPSLIDLIYN